MTDERLKMLESEGDKLFEELKKKTPGTKEYDAILQNLANLELIIESAEKNKSENIRRKHEMQIEDDKVTDAWRKYEAEQKKEEERYSAEQKKEEQRYLAEQEKEEQRYKDAEAKDKNRYDEEQKKKLGMDIIDRMINITRTIIEIAGIVVPYTYYHKWAVMEYDFEKDGFIHTTVPGKNLGQKIFPIFKRK